MRPQDEVAAAQLQGEAGESERLGAHHDVKAAAEASARKLVTIGDDDIEALAHRLEGNSQTHRDVHSDEVVGRAGIDKRQELFSLMMTWRRTVSAASTPSTAYKVIRSSSSACAALTIVSSSGVVSSYSMKNRWAHLWSRTNFSSQLKHRTWHLRSAISTGVSLKDI
jgi:hypothetical protein